MQKDYRKAFKYCKLSKYIDQYRQWLYNYSYSLTSNGILPRTGNFNVVTVLDFEPNNTTAKEFFPLIEEKLRSKLGSIFFFS